PDAEDLANPDSVQGAYEMGEFVAAFDEAHRLVRESAARAELEVGADGWPFPIPLVEAAGQWRFDTAAGREELLNRRIGRNELAVLRTLRAYVAAQRGYAARARDGDGVLEFAQHIVSTPGRTDGLYWPPRLNGELSPIGPAVARAQSVGYFTDLDDERREPRPFHGYYFKILDRQGAHAPGGRHGYVINGNMVAGFGLVAWPAEHGDSGVMTFIVNQQGRVHEKDLGPDTARKARRITAFDPDPSWRISRD
ncbi:MAG TPA: DUF2950 domain-containing protein, partial [Verrucomicrobiota bacterium]|nr:DUF2950 domain-containing protein [Verrucomicrobiota bacterium]